MIPQIQAIADLPFDKKVALVQQGLAYIDQADKMYLTLEAIDRLGRTVIANNPFVIMATELKAEGIECALYAEPSEVSITRAWQLAAIYTTAIREAIIEGIPLQQLFAHLIKAAKFDQQPDVVEVLIQWKSFCTEQRNREKQEHINGNA